MVWPEFHPARWTLVAGLGTRCDGVPSHAVLNMSHGTVDYLFVEAMP